MRNPHLTPVYWATTNELLRELSKRFDVMAFVGKDLKHPPMSKLDHCGEIADVVKALEDTLDDVRFENELPRKTKK